MGWVLQEERNFISAGQQDFELRCFVGPPREHVIHAKMQQDTPLDVSGVTKLTADVSATSTTVSVASTAGFPASGGFFIDTEFIEYGSKTDTTFTSLARRDPASHDTGDIVTQFTDITSRVYGLNISGSIEQHEWAGQVSGDTYDHRLLQPDRSMYFEFRVTPHLGHTGPKTGDGFTGVSGVSVTELYDLVDGDDNAVGARGLDWALDGNLWVATSDDQVIKVHHTSGQVVSTLTIDGSISNIEGIAEGSGQSLWIAEQALVGDSTFYELDRFSGTTLSSFDASIQPSGLCYDGEFLYTIDLDTLNIYKYDTDGVQQWAVAGPDPTPGAIAYWDGDLWVIGTSGRMYRVDRATGVVYSVFETGLTDAQGLALHKLGGRIGDSTGQTIHKLLLPASIGRSSGHESGTTTELFTLGANVKGMDWGPTGNLWVALDSDVIAEINPDTGSVVTSFSSPVAGLEGITHDGTTNVWVVSSSGSPKKAYKIALGPNTVTSSFNVTGTPKGIVMVGTGLYIINDAGTLIDYDTSGNALLTWAKGIPDPRSVAYFNEYFYVLSGSIIYVLDNVYGWVRRSLNVPTDLGDPQGLALSADYGHRIGDGTNAKVFSLSLTVSQDTVESTGGWSPWMPLYFGYIEGGSVSANHLQKTWSLRTRSSWMYLGESVADGRNLAPENISDFKPTTCSSVLSDPALEIGTEYISSPGEGIDCRNTVDDDLTTVWISQNRPFLLEGPDPIAGPIYGCVQYDANNQLDRIASAGDTSFVVVDHEGFPASGWLVIEPGEVNEETVRYRTKYTIAETGEKGFKDFVNANGDPATLQNNHPRTSAISGLDGEGRPVPCGIACPQLSTGEYCCDENQPGTYVNYNVSGQPVLPHPNENTADNLNRRLIFTEMYRPRLGLRPELNWWLELRNMSDRDHANLVGPATWSPWLKGQGFLIVKWYDLDSTQHIVNIPLSILSNQDVTIGPWVNPDYLRTGTCRKGWLLVVADRAEFNRWWSIPYGEDVTIIEMRGVPANFPDFGGGEVPIDFNRGELRYYWLNEAPAGINQTTNMLMAPITPSATSILVNDINQYPDYGLGMLFRTSRREREAIDQPYEWITWTGRTDESGDPPGLGVVIGYLTGVTRGVEGTKARGWTGNSTPTSDTAAQVGLLLTLTATDDLDLPNIYGDSRFKLSDYVRFDALTANLRTRHGHSYQRNGDRDWFWEPNKIPQPGSKVRTGHSEWMSVDLGQIDPPTTRGAVTATDASIELNRANSGSLFNNGVVLIDQEYIKYESINRDPSGIAADVVRLEGLTRGYDGTSFASHENDAQVWQVVDRSALVEHLVSGVSWHRKPDASDGIASAYQIWMTWRPRPRYPGSTGWEEDWDLVWGVRGNAMKNRGHFIQQFADVDSGVDAISPPGTLDFYRARHVMMVIQETNSGRAKLNEFKVYGTNPRVNLLAGSLDRETDEDAELTELQNTIAVFFDYVIRGFGLSADEVKVIGTGVNFYELPIGSGTYQSILTQLADDTGYKVWFNRFNQLWFTPNPATRRSMPVMTDLDSSMLREPLEIVSRPSGRVSQVIVYFRDDLSDETFEVRYPETPRDLGNSLSFDGVVVASSEEAKELARQIYQQENGEWEVVARFGIGHHFVLGHRYTLTYADWEASDTYFQGASFVVTGVNMNITTGPGRRWDTDVTLSEYHITV